jgi:hypothetical protein
MPGEFGNALPPCNPHRVRLLDKLHSICHNAGIPSRRSNTASSSTVRWGVVGGSQEKLVSPQTTAEEKSLRRWRWNSIWHLLAQRHRCAPLHFQDSIEFLPLPRTSS